MARPKAPDRPQRRDQWVSSDRTLTEQAFQTLDQIWRQVAAGYVIVPCTATGKNILLMNPVLHKEGGAVLATGMVFSFVAEQTSDGNVTALMADHAARKVYINGGATQAGAGDIVATRMYLLIVNDALDGAAGGFVAK